MFCRFCGSEVPEDAEFCPQCGKKLGASTARAGAKAPPVAFVITVLLFVASARAAVTMGVVSRVAGWEGLLTLAMLIAVVVLWRRGAVRPAAIRGRDALIPLAMIVLTAGETVFLRFLVNFVWQFYGHEAGQGASCIFKFLEEKYSVNILGAAWQYFLPILFLLLASGGLRLKGRHTAVLLAVLAVWGAVSGWVLSIVIWERMDVLEGGLALYARVLSNCYSLTGCLRLPAVCAFVILAGQRRLNAVRTVLFPVVTVAVSNLLLPLSMSMLQLPPQLTVFTLCVGYLAGLLVLLSACLPGAREKGREQEDVLHEMR